MTSWMQPPRLRGGEDDETRRATWLELFYDLVFVVAVSQVAHNLSQDVSLTGFVGFVALFVPLWWAWIGATLYANRFDTDTVIRRMLMGVQMLAIAGATIPPVLIIAIIAAVCAIEVGLDLYQGRSVTTPQSA